VSKRSTPSLAGRINARAVLLVLLACFLGGLLWAGWRSPTAWFKWGLWLRSCPPGQPIPELGLEARVTERGEPVALRLQAWAALPEQRMDRFRRVRLSRFEPSLALVGTEGQEWPMEPLEDWVEDGSGDLSAQALLPEVPDGDYLLRARAETPMGLAEAQAELALYAPALVHLATDKPIYQPGQTIRFRAVSFRLKDLTPLEGRPGRFTVHSPEGDLLLEEQVPSGIYGVAAGDLPLSSNAESGAYKVAYGTGAASDELIVQVKRYELPRFEVRAASRQAWYGLGERPVVAGQVRYRSGAPVAGAQLEFSVASASGSDWPPPTSWRQPRQLFSGAEGEFSIELDPVPPDLHGQATIQVRVTAREPAGERVESACSVRLSSTPIVAALESELQDGLVPDFNNRVYLRLTTPDGRPLPGVELQVSRAWDPADAGVAAGTDEDAVAALQLDPGQPVSVLVPPRPVREPLPSQQRRVRRQGLADLFSRGEVSLGERVILDAWDEALEPCALFVERSRARLSLGVQLGADGALRRVLAGESELERCAARLLRAQRGPQGSERFYAMEWTVEAAEGARLRLSQVQGLPEVPSEVAQALERGRQRSRSCVLEREEEEWLPSYLHWRARQGSEALELSWRADPEASGAWSAGELACLRGAFAGLRLEQPASFDAEGVARPLVQPDGKRQRAEPASATLRTAYELRVRASLDGVDLGETTVLAEPGSVPDLRLRPEKPVLKPGEELRINVLRGPDFSGSLPSEDQELPLLSAGREVAQLDYDADARTISGLIPADGEVHGLLTVQLSGVRALLWVPRQAPLELEVEPLQAQLRPGDDLRLELRTRAGQQRSPAAVSLFGLDQALGQLASLTGPDDFGRVIVRATSRGAAFGVFDARDLLTGRIRGENALLAALRRIDHVPRLELESSERRIEDAAEFDVEGPALGGFYALLGDARRRVAAWEEAAPQDELMTPERMMALWDEALQARIDQGQPSVDAFGLPLSLDRLPDDLLQLADPRLLVADARRLPEDVENWRAAVRGEEG